MHEHLRGIGAVARESGLPVSALRFYDAAGVLRPAWTDPATGYRWYSAGQIDQARLIARLRAVEMPLADIAEVVASRHRPVDALAVLERHRRALETRFAAARRQLAGARELLTDPPATRFEVGQEGLARALAAVRYAVGSDPAWPALTGILLDCSGGVLRLVACDRARLAISSVPAGHVAGPDIRVVVPPAFLELVTDGGRGTPEAGEPARTLTVELRVDRVTAQAPEAEPVVAGPVAADYPDYWALLRAPWVREGQMPVSDLVSRVVDGAGDAGDVDDVRDRARDGVRDGAGDCVRDGARDEDGVGCGVGGGSTATVPGRPDVVAVLLRDRGVDVVRPTVRGAVTFNRTYLLEALAAMDGNDVLLALDADRQVLAMACPARPGDKSLLMPVRPLTQRPRTVERRPDRLNLRRT